MFSDYTGEVIRWLPFLVLFHFVDSPVLFSCTIYISSSF